MSFASKSCPRDQISLGVKISPKRNTLQETWRMDTSNYLQIDWNTVGDALETHKSVIIVILATAIVGYFSLQSLLSPTIPKISVPLPRQAQPGWKGETLSHPSIRGQDSSVIQCYCPATGQLIDTVKAATIADVDTAIEKAKAAQLKWRQTTFKQRALVLKTLLKFILENQGISILNSCR